MSGGHFDFIQFRLEDVTDELRQAGDSAQYDRVKPWSEATLSAFKSAIKAIESARVFINRIDYLLSGDDNEEAFHLRLSSDLMELDERLKKEAGHE